MFHVYTNFEPGRGPGVLIQPVPRRDETRNVSKSKSKSSMVKVHFSFQMSRSKRDLAWPLRISVCILMTISGIIFSGKGCSWKPVRWRNGSKIMKNKSITFYYTPNPGSNSSDSWSLQDKCQQRLNRRKVGMKWLKCSKYLSKCSISRLNRSKRKTTRSSPPAPSDVQKCWPLSVCSVNLVGGRRSIARARNVKTKANMLGPLARTKATTLCRCPLHQTQVLC